MRPRILQGRADANDEAGPGTGPASGAARDQALRRRRLSRQATSESIATSRTRPGVDVAGASSTVNASAITVTPGGVLVLSFTLNDPVWRVTLGRKSRVTPDGVVGAAL